MKVVTLSLVAIVCSISLVACSAAGQANSKIQNFWTWFQQHEQGLYAMSDSSSQEFQEMANRLLSIDERLGCEIGPAPDGKKELAISANLRPELFSTVQEIVKDAPPLHKWKIVAFRQPVPPEMLKMLSMSATLASEDLKRSSTASTEIVVAVKNMRFQIKPPAEIKIFLKGYTGSKQEQYMATTLLQQAIGEYKFATEVSGLSFEKMTPSNEKESLPFEQLEAELDKRIANK